MYKTYGKKYNSRLSRKKNFVQISDEEYCDDVLRNEWGCFYKEAPRIGLDFDDDWQPGSDPLRPSNLSAILMGEYYDSL